MDIPGWLAAGGVLGSSGVGGIATKAFDLLSRRGRSQAYTMGAVDHAVQTAMKLVTDRLERVENQHEECEANLSAVRGELNSALTEIARLMGGPIAAYGGKPLPEEDGSNA